MFSLSSSNTKRNNILESNLTRILSGFEFDSKQQMVTCPDD